MGGGSGHAAFESGGNVPWVGVDAPPGGKPSGGEPLVGERSADEPSLGSIWSNDLHADPRDLVGFGNLAAPAIYADTERKGRGRTWRPFDVRPGNAAMIGLISVVSLVLLGMFLSVRARNNDVPTDASQPRTVTDDIFATGPLNTIPTATTVTATTTTTTAPAPAINLSELLPTTEATTGAAGAGTSGAATPAPSARTTPPATTGGSGAGSVGGTGGGASAATTPVTQPPATAAPPPPTTEVTSPPDPPPPVDDTTPTTRPPTPTITVTRPTFTIPSFPITTRPGIGGFFRE